VTINECGVDPGTDHASMRAIVERVHAQGGKITYFTSFAGGLPAPECDDNPFRYKFSWAPKVRNKERKKKRNYLNISNSLIPNCRVCCLLARTVRVFTKTAKRCLFPVQSCSKAFGSFTLKDSTISNVIQIETQNHTENSTEFR
jgi:hypothetical protein